VPKALVKNAEIKGRYLESVIKIRTTNAYFVLFTSYKFEHAKQEFFDLPKITGQLITQEQSFKSEAINVDTCLYNAKENGRNRVEYDLVEDDSFLNVGNINAN
jgi:hypothetical protein